MRPWGPLLILSTVLAAQAPFRIVGVERRGLPPYEPGDRTYRLETPLGAAPKLGDRLKVSRPGVRQTLGRLRVTEVRLSQVWAVLEPGSEVPPMKGDLAALEVLRWPPRDAGWRAEPLPAVPRPAPRVEAPPVEGRLLFLLGSAELSPAGHRKLEAWVADWGIEGRWAVLQAPARGKAAELQARRAATLGEALRALGVTTVEVQTEPRAFEGKHEPAWVRHWD